MRLSLTASHRRGRRNSFSYMSSAMILLAAFASHGQAAMPAIRSSVAGGPSVTTTKTVVRHPTSGIFWVSEALRVGDQVDIHWSGADGGVFRGTVTSVDDNIADVHIDSVVTPGTGPGVGSTIVIAPADSLCADCWAAATTTPCVGTFPEEHVIRANTVHTNLLAPAGDFFGVVAAFDRLTMQSSGSFTMRIETPSANGRAVVRLVDISGMAMPGFTMLGVSFSNIRTLIVQDALTIDTNASADNLAGHVRLVHLFDVNGRPWRLDNLAAIWGSWNLTTGAVQLQQMSHLSKPAPEGRRVPTDHSLVVPDTQNTSNTGTSTLVWRTTPGTVQMIYDASHFLAAGVNQPVTINRLQFRGADGVRNPGGQQWTGARVQLGLAATDWSTAVATFAANRGAMGPLSAPFDIQVLPISGGWTNDDMVDIDLRGIGAVFTYDPNSGIDLLIELTLPAVPVPATGLPAAATASTGTLHRATRVAGPIGPIGTVSPFAPVVTLGLADLAGYERPHGAWVERRGAGCGAQAQSFYQLWNYIGDTFDLRGYPGKSLRLLPDNPTNPTTYTVLGGSTPLTCPRRPLAAVRARSATTSWWPRRRASRSRSQAARRRSSRAARTVSSGWAPTPRRI
ncbi:MAG: hypothetical protein IPK26_20150 [Planctomycetes bacterium]|nr:hypothetical protein [Planctomycetota bacterium]